MLFNFTAEDETKIVSYITEMESSIFGLCASGLRRCMFQIANKIGRAGNPSITYPVFCVLIVMKNPTT
jgi:hypothetical protein